MPGVSTNTIWLAAVVRTPRIWFRVVCGRSETIETLRPTSRLTSVDFPTLGRPTTETKPERKGVLMRLRTTALHRARPHDGPRGPYRRSAPGCWAGRRR